MRTIFDSKKSAEELTNKQADFLQNQINSLRTEIENTKEELNLQEQELDNYKSDNEHSFSSSNITGNVINADVKLETPLVEADNIDAAQIDADNITANGASINNLTVNNLTANTKITAKEVEVNNSLTIHGDLNIEGSYNIENEYVEDLSADTADITELEGEKASFTGTLDEGEYNLSADTANITEQTSEEITVNTKATINEAEIEDLDVNNNGNINHLNIKNDVHSNVELYKNINRHLVNDRSVWIEVPVVNTGSFKMVVTDIDNTTYYFGINISYAGTNNATIQYDEVYWRIEPEYLGNIIWVYNNKLYFQCIPSSSIIDWKYEGCEPIANEVTPATYSYLPFDQQEASFIEINNASGTIFTKPVRIGNKSETGILTLSPTSWLASGDQPVQYDTTNDVEFGFYAPNQDLDKGASPQFHSIKLDTDGKSVVRANEDGIIYTQDPATVIDSGEKAGTLVPEEKLIEADDLYNYNGNSYSLRYISTPGPFYDLDEANKYKRFSASRNLDGLIYRAENNAGFADITDVQIKQETTDPSVAFGTGNKYTNIDVSSLTYVDEIDYDPAIGGGVGYKVDSGSDILIEVCKDVISNNVVTRTFTNRIAYVNDTNLDTNNMIWLGPNSSAYYINKIIRDKGASNSLVGTYAADGSASSYTTAPNMNLDKRYTIEAYTRIFNADGTGTHIGTGGVGSLSAFSTYWIVKNGTKYYICTQQESYDEFVKTYRRSANEYTSLTAAWDALRNNTFTKSWTVINPPNSTSIWYMPVHTVVDIYRGQQSTLNFVYPGRVKVYKKTVAVTDSYLDDVLLPPEATLNNPTTVSYKLYPLSDGTYVSCSEETTYGFTQITISKAYRIDQNDFTTGSPTIRYCILSYNSDGNLASYLGDENFLTPPATLNKAHEIIKNIVKEYADAGYYDIDSSITDHPIKNLGDGTIVHGSATVRTDLTVENDLEVERDTVLGSKEGFIDPDTGDPIQTNVTVKGTSDFKKTVQIGDDGTDTPANLRVRGGIYRYNGTEDTYEEIDSTYQRVEEKGLAGGYAPLDENARIPRRNMPYDVMEYRGSWDASSGVFPQGTVSDPLEIGDTYKVSVAGTIDGQYYGVNDEITYNGSGWDYYENNKVILGTTDLGVVGCMWLA